MCNVPNCSSSADLSLNSSSCKQMIKFLHISSETIQFNELLQQKSNCSQSAWLKCRPQNALKPVVSVSCQLASHSLSSSFPVLKSSCGVAADVPLSFQSPAFCAVFLASRDEIGHCAKIYINGTDFRFRMKSRSLPLCQCFSVGASNQD